MEDLELCELLRKGKQQQHEFCTPASCITAENSEVPDDVYSGDQCAIHLANICR